ncbi:mechanosensitive ion channel family protein [Microbacterium sp. SLBN-146]|uniref:mechanosensitive ion channel family protein n=1 Tax=Microbacterium sp. SLBN-146 TaxID=2768457 RepID=UPI001150596E|nr:mechanosensitive ion channel domain-containing protein [Microbacterium sp. SLBN-146]TQJ31018.1 small-conductance mechanosensitive channel [Microbacterium sp. SLBN-146]
MLDPWVSFAITVAVCLAAAAVFAALVSLATRLLARKQSWPEGLVRRLRAPFRVVLLLIGLWIAVGLAFPAASEGEWMPVIEQVLTMAVIAASAWMLAGAVLFVTDIALGRHRIDVPDNRVARRIRTQTLIVRRLAIVLIVIIAIGAMLLTFPAVRAVGASILASAGIASIVAGLAAQSVLANIFAGVQLVFSDALRVDDVVVVENEWGRIGEITLTYVVVNLWDDRRLVLPCTYFTTQPFQNWTRQSSELLGAVELDVDWRVSPADIRAHLKDILATTDLWDGRTSVVQVTDAVGGLVRVRILVTAKDAPTLFDLRCYVREGMVTWIQRSMPDAVPVQRVLVADNPTAGGASTNSRAMEDPVDTQMPEVSPGLFTGSAEAEERAAAFTNAIPIITADPEASEIDPPARRTP